VTASLFEGASSLRVRGERTALWGCILAAPITIALVSIVFPSVSFPEFVLLIVGGLAFVSISRGKLIGSSIRIDARQLPELHEIAQSVAARLGMATPQIFVRDAPFVPITAVGIGEPYALVISSQYYEHLRRGELAFLIARELAHIAAGHTRVTSLLSASGRENPAVALVFGAWLRRSEYTADRVGLLCCEGIEDALGGISISTYHSIGRRVDMRAIAEQRNELQADAALRIGEWTAAMPFATNRLEALQRFAHSPLAQEWRERLRSPLAPAPLDIATLGEAVPRRDCAPVGRRIGAFGIDLLVIAAIMQTPLGSVVTPSVNDVDADTPKFVRTLLEHGSLLHFTGHTAATLLTFFIYSAILVALGGQTLGMMVMELRVVTTRYARPTLVQSAWRYAVALGSAVSALALIGLFVRVHPHDRLSRTRLVRGRKTA